MPKCEGCGRFLSDKIKYCPTCHGAAQKKAVRQYQDSLPVCRCGKHIRKPNGTPFCERCSRPMRPKRVYRVDFKCPGCGDVRSVDKYHCEDKYHFQPLCGKCRPSPVGKKARPVDWVAPELPESPVLPQEIRINGCVLVKSRTRRRKDGTWSGRCADFVHCRHGSHARLFDIPKDRDCCLVVGRQLWDGWKCTVANPDIVSDDEQMCEMLERGGTSSGTYMELHSQARTAAKRKKLR